MEVINQLNQFDQNLFLYLNNMGTPTWDGFWLFMTHSWFSLPIYVLVTYLLYRKLGVKNAFISLVCIFALVVIMYGFTEVIKQLVARPRPCQMGFDMRLLVDNCDGFSFYSRHTAVAFALAILIGKTLKPYYKYALLLMVIWSLLMAYSRIYVGKHFPGDVFVGLIVGLISGLLFYKLQQYLIEKLKGKTFFFEKYFQRFERR